MPENLKRDTTILAHHDQVGVKETMLGGLLVCLVSIRQSTALTLHLFLLKTVNNFFCVGGQRNGYRAVWENLYNGFPGSCPQ